MALPSTTVWELRNGSSDNNGGGWNTAGTGTDWTQQANPQYAITTATTVFATDPKIILHASAASDMVGNIAHVVSGTNTTAGFYEILSVSAGVSISVDANMCTGNVVNGVVNIGGAIKTISKITGGANQGMVAGNTLWLKGTWTSLSSDQWGVNGTLTNPIRVIGYGTTRGDGYLGRTNGNGALITTNFASLAYATGSFMYAFNYVVLECLNITGTYNSSNGLVRTAIGGVVRACVVNNAGTTSSPCGLNLTNHSVIVLDCDITNSGASGGLTALVGQASATYSRIVGCRVKAVSGVGINPNGAGTIIEFCTIYACAGYGISLSTVGSQIHVHHNTIVGGASDGINVATGSTIIHTIGDNMITDNAGYGINMVAAGNSAVLFNNRTRDNTLGATNALGTWSSWTNYGVVTTDTGSTETDYMNYAGNDYRLIPVSPAKAAGVPLYLDIGALQRQEGIMLNPSLAGGLQ